MTQITAPYNFVPLSGWIFFPDWAEKVSHDVPFREGVSGQIDIKITAETPILIANEQKPYNDAHPNNPGESHFCKINDRYAIPGTTLKGMIRSVLEIASFGKMGYVDDYKLGIRDISTKRVSEKNYPILNNNNRHQKAGFLRLCENGTGRAEIVPCKYVHIRHEDMSRAAGATETYIFTEGMTVPQKYTEWRVYAEPKLSERELPLIRFDIDKTKTPTSAKNLDNGQIQGEIVFTGQISDKNKNPKEGKSRDFVFYDRKENEVEPVSPRVLADFRFIHGEHEKNHQGPWPTHWQEKFFKKNAEIPVFYQCDSQGKIKSIGLAFMYKLAYDYSIGETIDHTHRDHRNEDLLDLGEVLFGKVHSDNEKVHLNLKSRISFGACFASPEIQAPAKSYTTVLNGPKPTFFPNYVRQDKSPQLDREKTDSVYYYRTYMQYDSEIRGWKRYPTRLLGEISVPPPPKAFGNAQKASSIKAQTKLFPLPEQTTFTGTVRFHNLRPEELGALLWALEWGGDGRLRHNIGMGKPLGFGVIKLEIAEVQLHCNAEPTKDIVLDDGERKDYRQKFEALMDNAYQAAQQQIDMPRVEWKKSAQLLALRAMAWSENKKATKEMLAHLKMEGNRNNEFNKAKQQGWVLPDYQSFAGQEDWKLFPRDNQPPPIAPEPEITISSVEQWLEEKITEVQQGNTKLSKEDALISKVLAEHWQRESDVEFKQQLLEHIQMQWREASGDPEVDWWETPKSNGMRKAKKIYMQSK